MNTKQFLEALARTNRDWRDDAPVNAAYPHNARYAIRNSLGECPIVAVANRRGGSFGPVDFARARVSLELHPDVANDIAYAADNEPRTAPIVDRWAILQACGLLATSAYLNRPLRTEAQYIAEKE